MKTKVLTNHRADLVAWDDFVTQHNHATPFHWSVWMTILDKSFCLSPFFLTARGETGVEGVLPLYAVHGFPGGKQLRSLPAAGILAANKEAYESLCKEAVGLRDRLGYPYVRIESPCNSKVNADQSLVQEQMTTVVLLNGETKSPWDRLSSNTRRKVRKAKKNGLYFAENIGKLKEFYGIYAENMHRLGTPVFGYGFLRNMAEGLSNRIRLFLIHEGTDLCGGMLCLVAKDQLRSLYVGMKREALSKYATYLLYWQAMETGICEGMSRFDLGTSLNSSGTFRFKQQWGGRNEPVVNTYLFDVNKEKRLPKMQEEKGYDNWKSRVWRKIPLPLANALGPLVRRSLPFG